ncbi:UDP-N-acetylgalactosamine-undecaprenyl-phosphate N-acetylgalactosaminephosphotransferase [bioreactor metagenome]|uniref:UDP-N-acetylgalactosamine-undecaprenyl-phosphate N-acetylgalactosaminephosphotransferase n=1 Tax=bioreactor metagenome TaxID=1076179 RepID=A0A645CM96_9ZZZZ
MLLKDWETLPDNMRTDDVKKHYDVLKKKTFSLLMIRIFDIVVSLILLILLSPLFFIISVMIVLDSKGGVFFRQTRVTQFGKEFKIFKFRTMVANAEQIGSQVTTHNDMRITRVGKIIRKTRLDEIPQLINIFLGDMTFVGTRPEVIKYVDCYTDEMRATLLLPAGVTSKASIEYKDEDALMSDCTNVDETYVSVVLPSKMQYNLENVTHISLFYNVSILVRTFFAVLTKEKVPQSAPEAIPVDLLNIKEETRVS